MLPFLELQHQVSWMVLLVITDSSRIMLLGPHKPDLLLSEIEEDVLVHQDHEEPHCNSFELCVPKPCENTELLTGEY